MAQPSALIDHPPLCMLDPIPQGEILMEEFMRPLGTSNTALARDLAVPANRISGIISGTAARSARNLWQRSAG